MERNNILNYETEIRESFYHPADCDFDRQTYKTQKDGVNMFIQLEQTRQLKRIADALEAINHEVDRKSRRMHPPGL